MTPARVQHRRLLALVPAICAVGVAVLMIVLAGGASETDEAALGFIVWNLIPHAALAVIVLEVSEHAPRAWPALAAGVALHAAVTVMALGGLLLDPSSTGALVFIFLPGYLLAVVVVTAIAAGITNLARRPPTPAGC